MNIKIKIFLIYLLLIILANNSFAEVDLASLVRKVRPAVVTVITYDKGKNPLGQGSGFFIDANGYLVTNYHVLEGAYHAEVRTYNGMKYPIKHVVGENKKLDLLILFADISRSSVQWINVTGTLPVLAERVVVVGSPMGLEQTVSEGIVSGVRSIPDLGEILQISAAISPGSSGGPVINMKGQVIGIVSFYLMKGQSLNFAIPAKYLSDLKQPKTIKTISEWAQAIDQKTLQQRQGRLFVHTDPKGARVRILNIKPKFYQGIMLIPGPYHIEASADRYDIEKIWVKIGADETKNLKISLKRHSLIPAKNSIEMLHTGIEYADRGEYKKAIQVFKQAILIDPDNAFAYHNLGSIYGNLGLYNEALWSFKQAIRINPDDVDTHRFLGVVYTRLGLYNEALWSFKQAIRVNPGDTAAHFNIGLTYLFLNNKGDALEQYKILKTLDAEMANELWNEIYK